MDQKYLTVFTDYAMLCLFNAGFSTVDALLFASKADLEACGLNLWHVGAVLDGEVITVLASLLSLSC